MGIFDSHLSNLENDRDALRIRIAELEADKRRLDWLENSQADISSEMIECDPEDEETEMVDGFAIYASIPDDKNPSGKCPVSATATTLRAAIDAAMEAKP